MRTLVKMVHGSHLYGLNTENSDTDYKSVYLPDMDEVLLGTYKKEFNESTGNSSTKNTKDDVDSVIFSLPKFIKMACDGDTVALDMLHCNDTETTSPEWEFICKNRHRFYTKNMKAFIGYARKQAAKYGIKGSRLAAIEDAMKYLTDLTATGHSLRLDHQSVFDGLKLLADKHPEHIKLYNGFEKNGKFVNKYIFDVCDSKYDLTSKVSYVCEQVTDKYDKYGDRAKQAKENKGIDWKALSHALRAAYQLEEIYLTGDLKYPLKDRQFLLDVKKGKHDYITVVAPTLEKVIDDLEVLSDKSEYPEKVDRVFWDDFLLSVYKGEFRTEVDSMQPKVKYGLYDTKNNSPLLFTEESNENKDFCGDSTFRAQFDYGEVLKLDSVDDVLDAVMPVNGSPAWYNAWSIERPVVEEGMFVTDGKLDPRFVVVKYTETVEPVAN